MLSFVQLIFVQDVVELWQAARPALHNKLWQYYSPHSTALLSLILYLHYRVRVCYIFNQGQPPAHFAYQPIPVSACGLVIFFSNSCNTLKNPSSSLLPFDRKIPLFDVVRCWCQRSNIP